MTLHASSVLGRRARIVRRVPCARPACPCNPNASRRLIHRRAKSRRPRKGWDGQRPESSGVKRLEDGAPVWTSEGGGRLAESALLQEEASKQLEMVDALLLGNAGAREGVALPATPPPVRDVGALCEPVEASPVDSLLATPARPARLYRPSPGQPCRGNSGTRATLVCRRRAVRRQRCLRSVLRRQSLHRRERGVRWVLEVERWRADQLRSLASACRKEGSAAVAAANKAADTVERCRRLCEAAGATQRGRVSSLAGDARRAGGELAKVELLAARRPRPRDESGAVPSASQRHNMRPPRRRAAPSHASRQGSLKPHPKT